MSSKQSLSDRIVLVEGTGEGDEQNAVYFSETDKITFFRKISLICRNDIFGASSWETAKRTFKSWISGQSRFCEAFTAFYGIGLVAKYSLGSQSF